ncbi:uncharacterized protein LOC132740251 [Ruditapes philippinarum]|uniref:uncharacterized protein LOC132740251 n=1 Tax=Ruditapes philippinarum TaxID=129788 RepID=UPI00295A9E84|nr:uncharacterized protein LOC132740251 [Ruditapes philippinarum]
MANQWGSSRIGQYSQRSTPNFSENINRNRQNVSRLSLQSYQGPFDRSTLVRARDELHFHIEHMQDTAVWYRIKQKTGVNIHGATYFDDGFGEASNTFSHAELHENVGEGFDHEDLSADTLTNERKNQYKQPTQTVTSSAEPEMSSFIGSVENNIEDNSNDSSCVIVEEQKSINSKRKELDLESDGLEIINSEADPDVIVIENSFNEKIGSGNPFNETNDLDNNNIGQFSLSDGQKVQKTTFKCDLCDFASDARSIVQQHLNKAIHFAASEYSIDKEGNMLLTNKMVLQNFKAKFKNVLVVCPDCLKVFPDIHSCATHCNLQHQKLNDGIKDRYGLIQVIQEEVCDDSIHVFKCSHCYEFFSSKQILTNHIKDWNHYPFSDMNNSKKIFFCVHCKTSFESYEKVLSHHERGHWKLSRDGVLKFAVFHYNNVECHTLPHGTSTLAGTSTQAGNSKRKHDGNTTEMEPNKKERRYNPSENLTTISNGTLNDTIEKHVNFDNQSHTERMDGNIDTLSKPAPEDSINCGQEETLTETFKCDYCPEMNKDGNRMYLHLVNDVHSSASTHLIDHQGNIMYLKNTKTITFEGANFKKVVPTCSSCNLLFDTPFICDDHNIRSHQSKGGYYHIADIVGRKPVKEPFSKKVCSVCKQEFRKLKQLNNHCTQSNHFPFQARNDCNIYTLCCYCSKTFSSYKVACSHVKKHEAFAKNDMLDLVILYVSKNPRKIDIPPYETTKAGELTSIRSKITSLKQMKKNCGKTGKSQYTMEIRNMTKLL